MVALSAILDRIDRPERPHDPAFVTGDGRIALRRGELAERIRSSAAAYVRAGFGPGARVAFGVRQDGDGIAWLLGAFRAGVVPIVLEPGSSPPILEGRLRDAAAEAIVVDGLVATVLHQPLARAVAARQGLRLPDPARLGIPTLSTSPAIARARRLRRAGGDGHRPLDGATPALVVFTSGSTGQPRGVVYGGDGIAALLEAADALLPLDPAAVVLGAALHLIVPALLAGAPVILPGTTDPRRLAALVRARGVSHMSLPPSRALEFARAGGRVGTLLLGSAPVRNVTLAELTAALAGSRILSVYGLTEYLLVAAVEAAERLAHDEREGDLVGPSIGDARVRAAEDGELHVSGPALALGYLGGSMPVDEIATGDLGRIDGAGRIVLTGRRKEMLIRGGENIYPALYEGLLAERAGLGAAIMVGVPDAHADEAVVLFAVPRPGEDAVAARSRLVALLAGPRSPLDSHAHPDAVLGLEQVPRAGRSGKPDRAALTRIAARHLGRALPDERLVSAERTLAPPVG